MFNLSKIGFVFSFMIFLFIANLAWSEICCDRRSRHNGEHAAWGGNGGSWGNPNSDWFGEYGWPERQSYRDPSFGYACHHQCRQNIAKNENNVDGAALYFEVCPCKRR